MGAGVRLSKAQAKEEAALKIWKQIADNGFGK